MSSDLKILNEILSFDSPSCSLQLKYIHTRLGAMFSLSDNEHLYMLEFIDEDKIIREMKALQMKLKAEITFGDSHINTLLSSELEAYFSGQLQYFSIPVCMTGSEFQNKVWSALLEIPYGEAVSYKDIAKEIGSPKAVRAVGNANGLNKIPIIIPCHRVISSSGKIGGYSGGIERKKFLLDLENISVK